MAEVAPIHLTAAVAGGLYLAAGGNASWHLLPPVRRDSYQHMAEAAFSLLAPHLRRQARAELLEELADELIAEMGEERDRLALAFAPLPSSVWPQVAIARTLYRRAKEERCGR